MSLVVGMNTEGLSENSFSDNHSPKSEDISVCLVKVEGRLGHDSFCAFAFDNRRGSGVDPAWVPHYDTLDQALKAFDEIVPKVSDRKSVFIGKQCAQICMLSEKAILTYGYGKPLFKEFTREEQLKIERFLKQAFVDPFSDSPSPQPPQKEEKPVKVSTSWIEARGGTEELSFDWVVDPITVRCIPPFAIACNDADTWKPRDDGDETREMLARIMGAYNLLQDGKTIAEEPEGKREAGFFVSFRGKHYLLIMMKAQGDKPVHFFVLDSLQSASVDSNGQIVLADKEQGHVRIFEDEGLYLKLERFLKTHESIEEKK